MRPYTRVQCHRLSFVDEPACTLAWRRHVYASIPVAKVDQTTWHCYVNRSYICISIMIMNHLILGNQEVHIHTKLLSKYEQKRSSSCGDMVVVEIWCNLSSVLQQASKQVSSFSESKSFWSHHIASAIVLWPGGHVDATSRPTCTQGPGTLSRRHEGLSTPSPWAPTRPLPPLRPALSSPASAGWRVVRTLLGLSQAPLCSVSAKEKN